MSLIWKAAKPRYSCPADRENFIRLPSGRLTEEASFTCITIRRNSVRESWRETSALATRRKSTMRPYPRPYRSGRDEAMVLSPDGEFLAFSLAAEPPESSRLVVLPARGGNPRVLVNGQNLFVQDWAADGGIYFSGQPNGTEGGWLWRATIDGDAPELVLGPSNMQGYSRPGQFGMSIHPNGRAITFTAGVAVQAEVWVVENLF